MGILPHFDKFGKPFVNTRSPFIHNYYLKMNHVNNEQCQINVKKPRIARENCPKMYFSNTGLNS